MICTCEKCRYTISAQSLPLSCPDCGSEAVRPATQMEQDWKLAFRRLRDSLI